MNIGDCDRCKRLQFLPCRCELFIVRVPEDDNDTHQQYGDDYESVAETFAEEWDMYNEYDLESRSEPLVLEIRKDTETKWRRFNVAAETVIDYSATEAPANEQCTK